MEKHLWDGPLWTVYSATDARNPERRAHVYAVRHDAGIDRNHLEAFARYTELWKTLSHPCIVPMLESGVDLGGMFAVTPAIDGQTLATRWKSRTEAESPSDTLHWVQELSLVLDALHQRTPPIVHRALMPDTVFLCRDGTVRMLEAGYAHSLTVVDRNDLASKRMAAPYRAPEDASNAMPTPAMDQYALGVLAYLCLAGPTAEAEQMLSTALRQATGTVLHPAVERALARATAPLGEERFVSCGSFADALEAALMIAGDDLLRLRPQRGGEHASWPAGVSLDAVLGGEDIPGLELAPELLGSKALTPSDIAPASVPSAPAPASAPLPAPAPKKKPELPAKPPAPAPAGKGGMRKETLAFGIPSTPPAPEAPTRATGLGAPSKPPTAATPGPKPASRAVSTTQPTMPAPLFGTSSPVVSLDPKLAAKSNEKNSGPIAVPVLPKAPRMPVFEPSSAPAEPDPKPARAKPEPAPSAAEPAPATPPALPGAPPASEIEPLAEAMPPAEAAPGVPEAPPERPPSLPPPLPRSSSIPPPLPKSNPPPPPEDAEGPDVAMEASEHSSDAIEIIPPLEPLAPLLAPPQPILPAAPRPSFEETAPTLDASTPVAAAPAPKAPVAPAPAATEDAFGPAPAAPAAAPVPERASVLDGPAAPTQRPSAALRLVVVLLLVVGLSAAAVGGVLLVKPELLGVRTPPPVAVPTPPPAPTPPPPPVPAPTPPPVPAPTALTSAEEAGLAEAGAVALAQDAAEEASAVAEVADAAPEDAVAVAVVDASAPDAEAPSNAAGAGADAGSAVAVAAGPDASAPVQPSEGPLPPRPSPRDRRSIRDAVQADVNRCEGHLGRHARLSVVYTGSTGQVQAINFTGHVFDELPQRACIEAALRAHPLPPFSEQLFEMPYRLEVP